VILTSSSAYATISPLHYPQQKNKLSLSVASWDFIWAVNLPIQLLLWLSKVAFWISLGCLWPLLLQSSLSVWLPWEPSNLSGRNPGGPPWLSHWLSLGCLWPLLSQSSLPIWHESHLIKVDSTLVPPWLSPGFTFLLSLPTQLSFCPFGFPFYLSLFELSSSLFKWQILLFHIVYWFAFCSYWTIPYYCFIIPTIVEFVLSLYFTLAYIFQVLRSL
jgi:hypothetical protein